MFNIPTYKIIATYIERATVLRTNTMRVMRAKAGEGVPSLSSHKTLKLVSEQQTSVGTKIHALPNDNWNVQSKCQLQP